MMHDGMGGMMWGMGIVGLLILIVLVLRDCGTGQIPVQLINRARNAFNELIHILRINAITSNTTVH